jgi:peptide/nickel transport system substrate-binding protein
MTWNRLRYLAAVLLALALVGSACGGGDSDSSAGTGSDEAAEEPVYGGDLAYGLEAENNNGWCLPEAQLAVSGLQVSQAIYDTLTVLNADGEYSPFLAESVEPNENYTQWTISLREGVTFHDDSPLDAEVVKNNLDAYRGDYPARKSLLAQFVFEDVTSVDVVDDLTLTVTVAKPWTTFPAYLAGRIGIMAQAQLDDPDTCDSKLIGSGPFELEEWIVGESFTATRNENYWHTDADGNQLPYLDSVTFRPYVDSTARTNALLSGDIQALHTPIPEEIETLLAEEENGNVKVESPSEFREVNYVLFNTAKPPFDSLTARQALAHAIDREEYRSVIGHDLVDVASGPFAPGVMGHLDDAGMPEYDPDKARELVAQYEEETGMPLEFSQTILSSTASQAVAQFYQDQAAQVGIESTIEAVDQSAEISTALGNDWQVLNWRNHPGEDPDTQYIWWYGGYPTNFNKFDDPEINALLDEGRAVSDPAERQEIYEEINREFARELYNVWMIWTRWTIATASDVYGLSGPPLPDGSEPNPGLADGHPVAGMWISQ